MADKSPRRPLTGIRLTYELTMGGTKFRVRIKESIGRWLGLKPVRPQTGVFGASGLPVVPGVGGGNIGKRFLRAPAGYKFQSFTFLVKPGTYIVEPVPGCNAGGTRRRLICSFDIGFPKGPKETPITRWRVESWVNNSPRASQIIGFITPSGVKHVWKESMTGNAVTDNLPGLPDIGGFLEGAGLDTGDLLGLAGTIGGLIL